MKKAVVFVTVLVIFFGGILLFTGKSKASASKIAVTAAIQNASASPRKLALLVGISKYNRGRKERNHDWWDLNTEYDIKLLKEVLIRKFQFNEKDILVLSEPKDTTHQAIVDAFRRHLIAQAKAGDIIYFHFSGHGQQIPDDDGDEIDGYDETIIPSDYVSQSDGSKNIRDDEIGKLLDELKTKNPANVTVTLDSCYSGTATRGDLPVRGGPWMGAPVPKDKIKGEDTSASGIMERGGTPAQKYVFLSAASPRETAKETINEANQNMGLFTYALVKAFEASGPSTTYRDLFERIGDIMSRQRGDQTPQLEGLLDNKLMDGTALKPERYIQVKTDSKNKVILQAGKLQGMTRGSKFVLYPEGAKDQKSATKLADAKIIEADLITSVLEVIGTVAPEKLRAARAFETEHFYDDSLLKVAVQGVDTLSRGKEVLASVGKFELAETVTRGKGNWDILIHPPTPADVKDKIVDGSFRGVILERQNGTILATVPESATMATAVRAALEAETRWLTVKALENTDPSLSIEIRLVPIEAELNASGNVVRALRDKPLVMTNGNIPEFKVGDHFMLEVRNTGLEPAYITILNLNSEGKVGPGWPQQIPGIKSEDNRISNNGQWRRIGAPYFFVVTGPTGAESFKAIATREATDFTPLIDEDLLRGQRGDGSLDERGKNALNSPLGKMLVAGQQGKRSGIAGAIPPAWATATFNFVIRK